MLIQSGFNKSLSQKIWHIRLSLKTKSQHLPGSNDETPVPKKRCFTVPPAAATTTAIQEDVTRHTTELQKEWEKADGDIGLTSHISPSDEVAAGYVDDTWFRHASY